jgi:hypothetical protein
MKSYLLVLDHPWAAITGRDGRFMIPGLPPGEYTFTVWHEATGYIDRQHKVTIAEDGAPELRVTVDAGRLNETRIPTTVGEHSTSRSQTGGER